MKNAPLVIAIVPVTAIPYAEASRAVDPNTITVKMHPMASSVLTKGTIDLAEWPALVWVTLSRGKYRAAPPAVTGNRRR